VSAAAPQRARPIILRDSEGGIHDVESFREGFRRVSSELHQPQDLAATAAADAVLDELVAEIEADAEPRVEVASEVFAALVENAAPGKALGEDGLTSEVLRFLPPHLQELLYEMLRERLNAADPRVQRPASWASARAMLLPKLALAATFSDYREITLHAQTQKLYLKALTHLSQPYLKRPMWVRVGGGVRASRAAFVQLRIRAIVQKAQEWGLPLVVVKLDLKRAFVSLSHAPMLRWLLQHGAPKRLVLALGSELCHQTIRLCLGGLAFGDIILRRG